MLDEYIGYVYKVIHIPTGKYYIGCHLGTHPNSDRYLGSGRQWTRFKKGKSRKEFKKEVLCFCKTLEELRKNEKEFVGTLYINDENCLNKRAGGDFGLLKNLTEENKKSISNKMKGKQGFYKGKHFSEEHKKLISEGLKGNTNGRFGKGRTFSEEHRKKISEKRKKKFENKEYKKWWTKNVCSHKKESHPNYGKLAYNHGMHWYNNGIISIMRKECPKGFIPGRIKWTKK